MPGDRQADAFGPPPKRLCEMLGWKVDSVLLFSKYDFLGNCLIHKNALSTLPCRTGLGSACLEEN